MSLPDDPINTFLWGAICALAQVTVILLILSFCIGALTRMATVLLKTARELREDR